MRKEQLKMMLLLLCTFFSVVASAQLLKVTGTVTNLKNEAVPNVTVTASGTKKFVQTNDRGTFTIETSKGESIVFTAVGFKTVSIKIGDRTNISVKLQEDISSLQEITVTGAMDIKRNKRELGYSAQSVDGDEIKESQRENFINGLAGRVAGLTVNPTSGVAGASSSIVLRGFNSLSLSNQPLFVVDGIVMDNQTVDETSDGGRALGLASDRPNRNNDYTNRIADLNPNDIEAVTVLKGPEATALYGSQASSGAIIITTKKAKSNKFAVQYDNSFRASRVTRFPKLYDKYSNGTNQNPSNIFRYFGPAYSDTTMLWDNINQFFQTGVAQTHNLGMDFGVKNSVFRVSGSVFDQIGVVPANNYKRYNLRISNTTKIGDKIDLIPSISYVRSENDKVLRSAGGYLLSLLIWPNDRLILNQDDPVTGNKIPLFNSNANADYDNPLFNVNKNRSRDVNDRYTATMGINYRPTDWLSIQGRFGYDTYKSSGYSLYHPQSFYISAALNGSQDNYYRKYDGYNHTITATAKKKLGNFNFRAMGGTMWQDYKTQMYAVSGNNLTSPTNFDSSNTNPTTRTRLLRNVYGEYNRNILRQIAYFGEVAVNYKNMVFMNYTHRFESASTLPVQNRNYNYPGVSMSFIVSDIFPGLKKGNILSFWKLRSSLASTARLNTPYSTQSVFVNNFASGGGFSYGFTNDNPDLKPEKQNTYEVGTEIRLFKNRLSIDGSYYNTVNKGQIIQSFRLSYATGFVLNTQNAASTRNNGIELSLNGTIVANKNFGWNIQLNFNKMWNKVIGMPLNVSEYYISDTWLYGNARAGLVLNGPTTSITGYGYARNAKGDILIAPTTGLPVVDQRFLVRGDRNPDFTLGINNTLRYRNLKLSFLWDLKVGGDVFNATKMFMTAAGRSELTADRYVPRIIKGVLNDGKQESTTPTPNTISVIPAYNDAYYASTAMPEEAYIEKNINWLRLRDLTLAYAFPRNPFIGFKQIKTLEFFATGNDLFLFTNYTGADPAVNGNTAGTRGVGAFGFDYGTLAAPISVNIGARLGF